MLPRRPPFADADSRTPVLALPDLVRQGCGDPHPVGRVVGHPPCPADRRTRPADQRLAHLHPGALRGHVHPGVGLRVVVAGHDDDRQERQAGAVLRHRAGGHRVGADVGAAAPPVRVRRAGVQVHDLREVGGLGRPAPAGRVAGHQGEPAAARRLDRPPQDQHARPGAVEGVRPGDQLRGRCGGLRGQHGRRQPEERQDEHEPLHAPPFDARQAAPAARLTRSAPSALARTRRDLTRANHHDGTSRPLADQVRAGGALLRGTAARPGRGCPGRPGPPVGDPRGRRGARRAAGPAGPRRGRPGRGPARAARPRRRPGAARRRRHGAADRGLGVRHRAHRRARQQGHPRPADRDAQPGRLRGGARATRSPPARARRRRRCCSSTWTSSRP